MHLSAQPSNGPFLRTHYIGFHWAYQMSAFHLQLFPLESSDVCCTCRLHLLLKAEVNICLAVLKQRRVRHTVMPSRAGIQPLNSNKKTTSVSLNQHEILGKRSVSSQILVQFSKSLCSCLCQDYNRDLKLYAHSFTTFYYARMITYLCLANSNDAW